MCNHTQKPSSPENSGEYQSQQVTNKAETLNQTSKNPNFYEAAILADYAIKTALVQVSELDQQSIKVLQSVPGYQSDITHLMQGIKNASSSLKQAGEIARCIVSKFQRMEVQS